MTQGLLHLWSSQFSIPSSERNTSNFTDYYSKNQESLKLKQEMIYRVSLLQLGTLDDKF